MYGFREHTKRGGLISYRLARWRVRVIVPLALGLLLAPLSAEAQQAGKVYRIGWLGTATFHTSPFFGPFSRALGALGWQRQDFVIEHRWAWSDYSRFPHLAAELARLNVDVIVAVSGPAARAAMSATKTIPIVFTMVSDPVDAGLVASLTWPGGNVTGVTYGLPALGTKQLEVLKEAVPGLTRVAILWNPGAPDKLGEWRAMQAVAPAAGVELQSLEVSNPKDLEAAFDTALRKMAGALIVLWDPLTFGYARRIADLALKSRLPSMYSDESFVDPFSGGLMSYGPNRLELSERAAGQVDKILKGARPADLPVEQPTRFEFVVNLKTAKALGLTIPKSVLLRADQVIE